MRQTQHVTGGQDVSLAARVAVDLYFKDPSEEVDGGQSVRFYATHGHHGVGVDLGGERPWIVILGCLYGRHRVDAVFWGRSVRLERLLGEVVQKR